MIYDKYVQTLFACSKCIVWLSISTTTAYSDMVAYQLLSNKKEPFHQLFPSGNPCNKLCNLKSHRQ